MVSAEEKNALSKSIQIFKYKSQTKHTYIWNLAYNQFAATGKEASPIDKSYLTQYLSPLT